MARRDGGWARKGVRWWTNPESRVAFLIRQMGTSGVQREIRDFSLISSSSLDNCRAV